MEVKKKTFNYSFQAGCYRQASLLSAEHNGERSISLILKKIFLNGGLSGPQIYELLAKSGAEREKWIKYITEASTAYKSGMPKAKSEPEALSAKAVDGSRRPASFRDKTSSPRLERPDRQNSSPPEGLNIPRKEDEEDNGAPTAPKKRLQRVEILKIVDSTPMIEPSQVHLDTNH